jgi:hypothetical protein
MLLPTRYRRGAESKAKTPLFKDAVWLALVECSLILKITGHAGRTEAVTTGQGPNACLPQPPADHPPNVGGALGVLGQFRPRGKKSGRREYWGNDR